MTINAIASSNVAAQKPIAAPTGEARETGPDHDGDADDASKVVAAAVKPAAPVVNTSGQITGGSVNTKA